MPSPDGTQDKKTDPFLLLAGSSGITNALILQNARRTVFRVRGFSWFRAHVEAVAAKMASHIPEMIALQRTRADWTALPLNWQASYAPRQVNDAMNLARPKPMLLVKALQTILLCEAAAAAKAAATGLPAPDLLEIGNTSCPRAWCSRRPPRCTQVGLGCETQL